MHFNLLAIFELSVFFLNIILSLIIIFRERKVHRRHGHGFS